MKLKLSNGVLHLILNVAIIVFVIIATLLLLQLKLLILIYFLILSENLVNWCYNKKIIMVCFYRTVI